MGETCEPSGLGRLAKQDRTDDDRESAERLTAEQQPDHDSHYADSKRSTKRQHRPEVYDELRRRLFDEVLKVTAAK